MPSVVQPQRMLCCHCSWAGDSAVVYASRNCNANGVTTNLHRGLRAAHVQVYAICMLANLSFTQEDIIVASTAIEVWLLLRR